MLAFSLPEKEREAQYCVFIQLMEFSGGGERFTVIGS